MTTAATPFVQLLKPTPEQNNRRYDEKKHCYVGEGFSRGERIIVVDGERWGRTIVSFHGMHGTTHTFKQDHGEVIIDDPDGRRPRQATVRIRRDRYRSDSTKRATDEVVLYAYPV